jgi:dolichyl-phosphate-mannose--protein O-mannosyl transferase
VKLIAVVFLFPAVVFALFFQTSVSRAVAIKRLFNIFFVSMTVLTLSYGTHWILFSTNNRLQTWSDLGIVHFDSSIHPKPPLSYFEKPAQHLAASILDVSFSLYGYVTPTDSSSAKSFWYEWPFNKGSFDFFRTWRNKLPATIALAGNPIVLLLSTTCVLIVFLGILILVISRGALVEKIMLPSKHSVLFFLISGYLFSLMPFMIVPRATYLYHYFPAYLFAIGIFSFLVDYLFTSYLRSRWTRVLFSLIIILFIIFGFVYQSPATYGYSGDGIFASFLSFF